MTAAFSGNFQNIYFFLPYRLTMVVMVRISVDRLALRCEKDEI